MPLLAYFSFSAFDNLLTRESIKASIELRSQNLKQKERSTILKPLNQAQSVLNSGNFLAKLQTIHLMVQGNQLPLQLQEIRTLILYVGSKYNIETGRVFQKYKETQELSLALYHDSWWPFIQCATAIKEGKTHDVLLNIPAGMSFIDMNHRTIVVPSAKTVRIPVVAHKEAQELNVQQVIQQPANVDVSINFQTFDDQVQENQNETHDNSFGQNETLDNLFGKYEGYDDILGPDYDDFDSVF